jgi:ABC-type branched-subunit amino acid transport system permease subunit
MSAHNPYSSPMSQGSFPTGNQPAPGDGFINQVPVVGILMGVAGGTELLMGLFLIGCSIFVPQLLAQAPAGQQQQLSPDEAEFASQFLFWIYLGMGSGGVVGGLLRLVAGIQVFRFRSHTLGIIGSFAGLLAITTCYCSPLSVGISIYGLIVLFQSPVRAEFQRRTQYLR